MTEHDNTVTAAWHGDGLCLEGHSPLQRIRVLHRADLLALPQRLAELLAPGQVAVGLLGYHAGALLADVDAAGVMPLAEVQIFAAEDIRRRPLADAVETGPSFALQSDFRSEMPSVDYRRAIARIHDYLRAGDCYQINLARRFSSHFRGDPLSAWRRLSAAHPAPHSSFFRFADGDCVFGVSPERFLQIRNGIVVTEPIKGSRPRGITAEQDQKIGEALQSSPKDRAENLMIVDLLRNDLGQVCEAGSVKAEPLFELRRFSNVQHLVSTITGTLRAGVLPLAALLACFPGGSITGAPKKRAMQIIAELELVPRGFYCGSQFVLDSDGNLDSNILIRTFQTSGEQIVCHGGGGIVIDSDAEQEYQESLFKVEKLMASL